ncbi:MAG: hypothetical protein K1X83_13980 [Oligoflexia bacterium]|nr:hypothetical protein [Oligoflexia bacterium]
MRKNLVVFLTVAAGLMVHPEASYGDKICVKASIGQGAAVKLKRRVVAQGACPSGFMELIDTADLQDLGADSSSVYGNGSAGAFSLASGSLTLNAPNLQFTNFTVASGASLNIASGTVIRCRGSFENRGTINIERQQGTGGTQLLTGNTTITAASSPGRPGPGGSFAASGSYGAEVLFGGIGAPGLSESAARNFLLPGAQGGGGGGAGDLFGGDGGGTLAVLASGAIVNSGQILGFGGMPIQGSGGGGGGGIVTLASMTSVSNAGLIDVHGAKGSDGELYAAPGGGGGGGIVNLFAPIVSNQGQVNISGGLPGAAITDAYPELRISGGAGGSSGGSGGSGATVLNSGSVAAAAGGAGHLLITTADPSALL